MKASPKMWSPLRTRATPPSSLVIFRHCLRQTVFLVKYIGRWNISLWVYQQKHHLISPPTTVLIYLTNFPRPLLSVCAECKVKLPLVLIICSHSMQCFSFFSITFSLAVWRQFIQSVCSPFPIDNQLTPKVLICDVWLPCFTSQFSSPSAKRCNCLYNLNVKKFVDSNNVQISRLNSGNRSIQGSNLKKVSSAC